jgi:hypothetical protein
MFGSCFWFVKKTFIFSNNHWSPPPSVLCISHSGSLPRRPPPAPLGPSHFPLQLFNSLSPPPSPSGPSHFSLRFFTPSILPFFAFLTPIQDINRQPLFNYALFEHCSFSALAWHGVGVPVTPYTGTLGG